MHRFIVEYGTIPYFKQQLATLPVTWHNKDSADSDLLILFLQTPATPANVQVPRPKSL